MGPHYLHIWVYTGLYHGTMAISSASVLLEPCRGRAETTNGPNSGEDLRLRRCVGRGSTDEVADGTASPATLWRHPQTSGNGTSNRDQFDRLSRT